MASRAAVDFTTLFESELYGYLNHQFAIKDVNPRR